MAYPGLSLENHVAFVTGAGRGIGKALAIGLAQAGAEVAVSDLPDRLDEAEATSAAIRELGRSSIAYPLDVRDLAGIREVIGTVVDAFGKLDILLNNAGTLVPKSALETTEEDWDQVLDTNLKGPFFCAQAAAQHMLVRGHGRIINIASQLSEIARMNRGAYCASKGGLANLTRALALEWIKGGVTVNAIGPGVTLTPMNVLIADPRPEEEVQRDLEQWVPLGRRLKPEELVGAAVYLASPASSATTGHLLIVDGGWTIW